MSFTVEKLEKNMAKLIIEVPAADFEKAITEAYNHRKGSINVPGFRNGKVPQAYLEKMYGAEMFYEDAANICIQNTYPDEAEKSELEIVSKPDIDAIQMEKGKNFIYSAKIALKPEVTLGEYKGLEVEKADITVTDEEVANELENIRKQNARTIPVEDRAAALEDEVIIDFEGFIDEVAFEGGKGEGYSLVLGSHSFIDTFEDQIVGKNVGEEFDVNVNFPEEYQAPELAGKPAVFKVKVNEIKTTELPTLDDEFADEVSEFDTLEAYKEDLKSNLADKKAKEALSIKENAVIDKIIENATMDVPEGMIEHTKEQMVDEFAQRMSYQGLSIEQYFQFTGMDREKFMVTLTPEAERRIKSRLVLEAIVKAENIEASEEEFEQELNKMSAQYQMEIEKLKELIGESEKKAMKFDMAVQKAVDFVTAQAKEV